MFIFGKSILKLKLSNFFILNAIDATFRRERERIKDRSHWTRLRNYSYPHSGLNTGILESICVHKMKRGFNK